MFRLADSALEDPLSAERRSQATVFVGSAAQCATRSTVLPSRLHNGMPFCLCTVIPFDPRDARARGNIHFAGTMGRIGQPEPRPGRAISGNRGLESDDVGHHGNVAVLAGLVPENDTLCQRPEPLQYGLHGLIARVEGVAR